MHSPEQRGHDELPPGGEHGTRRRWGSFAWHYVEMALAMGAGMLVLGGALRAVLAAAGVAYDMDHFPTLTILEMALTMVVGMAAWMRFRGHRWPGILEMSAAMLAPAVLAIPLVRLDVLDAGTAMAAEHVAMFLAMLAVMLRRRDEYAAAHGGDDRIVRALRGSRILRPIALGVVLLLGFTVVPAAVLAASSISFAQSRYAQPEATGASLAATASAAPAPHDPSRPTAVVVVGNHGANVADVLVPYDILATTGGFNVYTVAPERRPVPLLGGLDLVPDLDFAGLAQRLGGSAPHVTVVPEMPDTDIATGADDAAVTGWLRDTATRGLVLGVCTGARLLAEAGLLDGRPATSHWYRLDGLQHDHPAVGWQRGLRYLDDGDVITTGGLLSSVDGTLRVVERLLGPGAAAVAAREAGWRHYRPGTASPLSRSTVTPLNGITHILDLGFRSSSNTMGVLLADGVGELQLAAAFAPYAEVKAARTLAIGAGGTAIRSRHGLTFLPRAGLDAVTRVDHLLVPGAGDDAELGPGLTAARAAGTPVERQRPGFAFDTTVHDMARIMDVPTAQWTAKILEYPPEDLRLAGAAWPWPPTARALLLGLAGLAAALGAVMLRRRLRARRSAVHPTPDSARPHATTRTGSA